MTNRMGLPAAGQQEILSNSHVDDYDFGPDEFVITPGNGEWTRDEWAANFPTKSAAPGALNLTEFEAPWYVGLVLVVGGAVATVMYALEKAAEWGVL